MKTIRLSTAAFVLGSLAASIAACSAQSTSEPPRGDAGATNTGTAGTGTVGTGNSPGVSGTGNVGTGNSPGVSGTGNVGTGGTTPIGTAGSTSTGTAGSATTGAGGGSGMSCGTLQPNASDPKCCVAAGTATDLAIDDLEDLDNTILPIGNRQGYWYSYSDKTSNPASATTLTPNATPFTVAMTGHACSLMPVPPACAGTAGGTKGSAEIAGMVNLATMTTPAYAGMGFDFNNHFMKSCGYGASAYHGITFWAKGSPFKASIKIPATTGSSALSAGTCAAMCEDHYSQVIAPPPDGSWGQVTIMFSDTTKFKQAGWGTAATFDPSNILAVQFQIDGTTTQTAPAAYDFAVDDLAFVP